jgi:hypothetical protein
MEAATKQVSTMMEEPAYDPATQTLTIHFKKGGSYTYPDFPAAAFEEFHSAESWGKYYHANKGLFANGVKRVSKGEQSSS